MAAYNKFQDYAEQKLRGTHDWASHTFKIMLTNAAPVATNAVKADLTEIGAGNGYVAGGTATTIALSETGGTSTVTGTEVVFTASGGSIGPFRYVVLYNDTAASDNLVAWWDYGTAVTLADGETFKWRPSNASPGTIFTDA